MKNNHNKWAAAAAHFITLRAKLSYYMQIPFKKKGALYNAD